MLNIVFLIWRSFLCESSKHHCHTIFSTKYILKMFSTSFQTPCNQMHEQRLVAAGCAIAKECSHMLPGQSMSVSLSFFVKCFAHLPVCFSIVTLQNSFICVSQNVSCKDYYTHHLISFNNHGECANICLEASMHVITTFRFFIFYVSNM